jgi:HK97 family phage major capsid protein
MGIGVMTDSGQSGYVVQPNASAPRNVDPTFSKRMSYETKISSGPILIPRELERDGGPNFIAKVLQTCGNRVGFAQAAQFATGSGIGAPLGFAQTVDLGTTAASSTAIAADELHELFFSVDPFYWTDESKTPIMTAAPSTVKAILKLKDGAGRYVWKSSGLADMCKLIPNRFLPSIAAGGRAVWFGDFSTVFIHEINYRIVRYSEAFAEQDCVAYEVFASADSVATDRQGIKALQMS